MRKKGISYVQGRDSVFAGSGMTYILKQQIDRRASDPDASLCGTYMVGRNKMKRKGFETARDGTRCVPMQAVRIHETRIQRDVKTFR